MFPISITLDGLWDFFYTPVKFDPEKDKLPPQEKFTGKMVTPGYWDDHLELFDEEDFFGLTARFNPDYRKPHFPMGRSLTPHASSCFLIGTGFYRKEVDLRAVKESQFVSVNIGPAMWGCSLFVNGKCAGSVSGYSTASDFDISHLVEYGKINTLIIAVDNVRNDGGAYCNVDGSHAGIPFGTRPGQHRGLAAQGYQSERAGIGGGVTLKVCRDQSALKDHYLAYCNGKTRWHITTSNGIGKQLFYSLEYQNNAIVQGTFELTSDKTVFETEASATLWSDREPVLCDVKIAICDGADVCDKIQFKWGAVNVSCKGTKLLVNGVATYFRGVTEHCYFAETTNPHFDKEKYLHDLGVLKAAGVNFIRCHTWCPPEPFYEACDELGIFVQTEFPSVYTFDEVRAILQMIRRHTCAVIVCEGNEKYIDDAGVERLREVCRIAKEMIPNILFNPQEAIRGVEYGFTPDQKTEKHPFEHDAQRFSKIAEFSDVYGSLGGGFFSYGNDAFPGVEAVEKMQSLYQKPCLSHEIGILGGYLDFSLEERYRNTFIGTDMFEAARRNMQKHGVWQFAEKYYTYNTLFITSIRKQLMENIRSCPSIAGYDYLGGIDTHWHLIGYPCGIFNEFYEEKYGESIADVAVYNGESVLLSGRGKFRNVRAGEIFENDILLSYYGGVCSGRSELHWQLEAENATLSEGIAVFDIPENGTVSRIATVSVQLPKYGKAVQMTLKVKCDVNGKNIHNSWKFWAFPDSVIPQNEIVRCVEKLDWEDIAFMEQGGRVLLTSNFPCETMPERFAPHTSGRSIGHSGVLIKEQHPVWQRFPHEGFADWQFYPMMSNSTSLVSVDDTPKYAPLMELIPSFKLIKRKSFLSEYRVGKGVLMLCGLRLDADDPGAEYLKHILLGYLAEADSTSAPEWEPKALTEALSKHYGNISTGKKIDAGGRPVD
ncbi:MAG: hypothetical protein IJW08_02665 [Lentisphaeria bacterium]|nr:hypothetical protein [Lentisphaeria bacterium]